jgi:DNA-directed RNA polymerase subunit M/transcription elongation factor TFIIS
MRNKTRKSIPSKIKVHSILQKEINSTCPFCSNKEVQYFQIHHIDENPSNNDISNLILICPLCYSKITSREISIENVKQKKQELPIVKNEIECADIKIDKKNCSWIESPNQVPNSFYITETTKYPFPILFISLINQTENTILLKSIKLRNKELYSGLGGIPEAFPLKKTAKYKMKIPANDEVIELILNDEIVILPKGPAKFEIQLYTNENDEKNYLITTRNIVSFTFCFNNNITLQIPNILLNTENENKGVTIIMCD